MSLALTDTDHNLGNYNARESPPFVTLSTSDISGYFWGKPQFEYQYTIEWAIPMPIS